MARYGLYVLFIAFFSYISNEIIKQNTSFNYTRVLSTESYNISRIENFLCEDASVQCSGFGVCNVEKDDCDCFEGYATVFNFEDLFENRHRCNYKLKKQIYAIAFALFISFGFAHFYLGNFMIGFFQMFTFIFIFAFGIFVTVRLSIKHTKKVTNNEFKRSLTSMVMVCLLSFVFLFWYMFDIFMILFNAYRDGNNIEMLNMNK
jgi:hypothetical protein